MKKTYLLTISLVIIVLALSSCAINVFKQFDAPSSSNALELAAIALNAAKSGDTQTALNTSAQVFQILGNATSTSLDLYTALTTQGTQSDLVIDLTASDVQNVFKEIESGQISPTSTTASAAGMAAQAMVTSIYQAKNIQFTTAVSGILSLLSTTSGNGVSAKAAVLSSTVDSTTVVEFLNLIIPQELNVDISEASLLTNLNTLISSVSSDTAFNDDLSSSIWEGINFAITLFDTNGSGSLNSGDAIYPLIKDGLSPSGYSSLLSLTLVTYGNQIASANALSYANQAMTCAENAVKNLPSNMNGDEGALQNTVDNLSGIFNGLTAQKFSTFRTFGDFINYCTNNW